MRPRQLVVGGTARGHAVRVRRSRPRPPCRDAQRAYLSALAAAMVCLGLLQS